MQRSAYVWHRYGLMLALVCFLGVARQVTASFAQASGDPPEIAIGERLFLETRFAQFFQAFVGSSGDVNTPLSVGDPALDQTSTTRQPLPGPFAGQSMNCRACHLVDEHVAAPGGGMRTYTDFARRSPVPARADGATTAVRNAPPLVNAALPRREGLLLHFDGEFASLEDLIQGTYTGRNFGWFPLEQGRAIVHIARVIRADNGQGELAQSFDGLPYAVLLTGTAAEIPEEWRLPAALRVDVATASDRAILRAVAQLVAAYTANLVFAQDSDGAFHGSPYDVFLERNGLPRQPERAEEPLAYSRRLLRLIQHRERHGTLTFVDANPHTTDGAFEFHAQVFVFGPQELQGLKIFLREPATSHFPPTPPARGAIGNCVACHPAPNFTDFRLHNTGVTQAEYDRLHGQKAFAALAIPPLWQRNAQPNRYLPATAQHPQAQEPFRAVPVVADPRLTDLGLWNIFANPDFPAPQRRLWRLLCEEVLQAPFPHGPHHDLDNHGGLCWPETLLRQSIARFKTPGLRDLSHSAPYMHNGQFDTLSEIIAFYRNAAALARSGALRNGARALQGIVLDTDDTTALVAFLRALNEDYQ